MNKFLCLLQEENEPIASWEMRVHNQGSQCKYKDFADKLMKDQFIAGSTSKALRVKLIGNGHRHRDSQVKQALREVVEAAKCFEATTFTNQLMKTARGNQSLRGKCAFIIKDHSESIKILRTNL